MIGRIACLRVSLEDNKSESSVRGRQQSWIGLAILIASALYAVVFCCVLSGRRMMWVDEFHSWALLTDPSASHAIQSWNLGVDSGGPLFYLLGRALFAVTGPSVLAIRLLMAGFVWAAAVVWWKTLESAFSAMAAFLAVVFIWLCSPLLLTYLAELRCYPLLLFSTSVVYALGVWSERAGVKPAALFAMFCGASLVLVSSHSLGLCYSAILCFGLLFSRRGRLAQLASIAGCLAAWPVLLFYRAGMLATSRFVAWITLPDLRTLVRYYFFTSTHFKLVNVLVLLLCGISVAGGRHVLMRSGDDRRRMLLLWGGLLLAVPVYFYILSHVSLPLFGERYLMPYYLGLAVLVAAAFWLLEVSVLRRFGTRVLLAIYFATGLALLALHIAACRDLPVRPPATLSSLLAIQLPGPLVVEEINVFLEMEHYGHPPHPAYIYPIPDPATHARLTSSMAALSARGYAPGIQEDSVFLNRTEPFYYLDFDQPEHAFQQRALTPATGWTSVPAATVELRGIPYVPDGTHVIFRYSHR